MSTIDLQIFGSAFFNPIHLQIKHSYQYKIAFKTLFLLRVFSEGGKDQHLKYCMEKTSEMN